MMKRYRRLRRHQNRHLYKSSLRNSIISGKTFLTRIGYSEYEKIQATTSDSQHKINFIKPRKSLDLQGLVVKLRPFNIDQKLVVDELFYQNKNNALTQRNKRIEILQTDAAFNKFKGKLSGREKRYKSK